MIVDLFPARACCFTGHRPQNLPFGFDERNPDCIWLKQRLETEIRRLITYEHTTCFYSGMGLGVDQWAAEIVLKLREKYSYIRLKCVLPCETQAEFWTEPQRDRYFSIVEQCDEEIMLQGPYTKGCMQKRNKFMVDSSNIVLAVWNGEEASGTGSTVRYAQKKEREIFIINPARQSSARL